MSKKTRFRAYQLGTTGSSFSYSVDGNFTLIEARLNETNYPNIIAEMKESGCSTINCLHITSWDKDHCNDEELKLILQYLKPVRIEYPGYTPDTDSGKNSLRAIQNYAATKVSYNPSYINALEAGKKDDYNDIVYQGKRI